MILYHMSQTLKPGDVLTPDYQECARLCEPFIQALEYGEGCFYGMVLNAKYTYVLLNRYHLREWSDYAKWATEGAFEFIRRREYPQSVSRLNCHYFYADLADSVRLYQDDWGEETEEERAKVRLFEVELDDEHPDRRDMSVYDAAYEAMSERQDVRTVFDCARRYFSGGHGPGPVWETLSARRAVAVRDISRALPGRGDKTIRF